MRVRWILDGLMMWIGAPTTTPQDVKREQHEKERQREEVTNRTRDEAVRVITNEGGGMSFDDLADAVGMNSEERKRGTHREG